MIKLKKVIFFQIHFSVVNYKMMLDSSSKHYNIMKAGGIPSYGGPQLGGNPQYGTPERKMNFPGTTVTQRSNTSINLKYQQIPWENMMHNSMIPGMHYAINSYKAGQSANMVTSSTIGHINSQSIQNFRKHKNELDVLLPHVYMNWFESPIRDTLVTTRDINTLKSIYGPSTLETMQKAHDFNNGDRVNMVVQSKIQEWMKKDIEKERQNKKVRDNAESKLETQIKSHVKNEFSVCSVERMCDEWKFIGSVVSTLNDKREPVNSQSMNSKTSVGVTAGKWARMQNVWSNNIRQGTYLFFIIKNQPTRDGGISAPVWIPYEGKKLYDKSGPSMQERSYYNAQNLLEYGPYIVVGMVAERPDFLSKSDTFKNAALGFGGESWEEIRNAAAKLDQINVELIKGKNVYF